MTALEVREVAFAVVAIVASGVGTAVTIFVPRQSPFLLYSDALLFTADEAIAGFDALITTDQNLKYQQNLPQRRIAIVVLLRASWPRIERHITEVSAAIDTLEPAQYLEIQIP